jgi:type I restriction enzyme S subunit
VTAVSHELIKTVEPWIKETPQNWGRFRIKDIALFSPGFSDSPPGPTDQCVVIPMEAISAKGDIDTTLVKESQDIQQGLTNFEKGDVLFAKITPCMENGKGAFVEALPTRYGFGSTEFHVLRPGLRVDGKFLYYFTFNSVYRDYASENMTGAAGQKRVSAKFLAYTSIFLPAVKEQRRVAAYLDKACAAIDGAIRAKRRQLEVLDDLRKSIIHKAVTRGLDEDVELTESGIQWVEKKPLHWRTCRIKEVCDFFNTVRVPLSAEERGQMNEKVFDYYGASGVIDKVEGYLFDGTYILIAEDGANLLRRSSPLAFIASGKFWVNNHAHILRPRFGDLEYFVHLLESLDYSLYVTGSAQPKLTKENLEMFKIIVPPSINEQKQISAFLRDKNEEIQALKNNLGGQISALEQYRKSLIHECVTGKRRIEEADLAVV